MSILALCEWVENTAAGALVRESLYGFPALVTLHIMGLGLSAGTLLWFDLRLLGFGLDRAPVTRIYRQLMPWAIAGFLLMFATGAMLFVGFATAAYGNIFFRLKMTAILLAGLNALVYHRSTERTIAQWDAAARPPAPARAAGLISLVLWTIVVVAGRMMSYTLYSR
jgi:hypothetical protein